MQSKGGQYMKKYRKLIYLCLLCAITLLGCSKTEEVEKVLPEGSYRIYTINLTQTGLDWNAYRPTEVSTEGMILELLGQLSNDPESFAEKQAINENVIVKEIALTDGKLLLDFDALYQNQKEIDEALMRAAIVKTLAQVKSVESIEFYVNGVPLTDAYDKTIGQMTAADFIERSDVQTSCIPATFSVYFGDEDGGHLIECVKKDFYDGSLTMEQLVLNHLIDGPDEVEQEQGMKATIPSSTVLNNITIKEGVCYVDFSSDFLNPMDGVDAKVSIYSVVNTLVELNNINKVQIMIDGKIVENYRDNEKIDSIFERDLDLVKGTK